MINNNNTVDLSFQDLNVLMQEQFKVMTDTGKLFVSSVSGDLLWQLYINSFKAGDNPVFRDPESTVNNCNNDKHFIRRYGNIVALDNNNNIITMFDIDVAGSTYESSITEMRAVVKEAPISNVYYIPFFELNELPYEKITKTQDMYLLGHKLTHKRYTTDEANKFGVVNDKEVYTFYHFNVNLPKQFVSFKTNSVASIVGEIATTYKLFIKGLQIPLETLEVIRDLMIQGSLLRADLYQSKVEQFITIKQEYEAASNKANWAWKRFSDIPFARFANELVGTTCIELAEGEDINKVCKTFNVRVDPTNYMKATAAVTQKQIDSASNRISELGYEESFNRRFATASDIDLNEILHTSEPTSNKSALFSNIKATKDNTMSRHKRAEFDGLETVSIEVFMRDVLPNAKSLSVLLEGDFSNNLVALTTANDRDCKPLFKWTNPFSWTYKGNLAGVSLIKEAVKSKGGNIEGVLRGSLIWNEGGTDKSDLDVWCVQPNEEKIGFSTFRATSNNSLSSCGGQLDLDNTYPGTKLAVENIYFKSLNELKVGTYLFYVNPYIVRNSKDFKFEIEFDGKTFNYEYNSPVNKNVKIAEVTFDGTSFSIKHLLEPVASTVKDLWSLECEKFHKVNLMCLSPNYWGDNAIGNKHYFFFLDNCKTDNTLRSFHIENLNGELLQDRKVLEVFGLSDKLEPNNKQLAGIGFTGDSKQCLIVKVEGSFKRTVKVTF
jgi:hypothetical protein